MLYTRPRSTVQASPSVQCRATSSGVMPCRGGCPLSPARGRTAPGGRWLVRATRRPRCEPRTKATAYGHNQLVTCSPPARSASFCVSLTQSTWLNPFSSGTCRGSGSQPSSQYWSGVLMQPDRRNPELRRHQRRSKGCRLPCTPGHLVPVAVRLGPALHKSILGVPCQLRHGRRQGRPHSAARDLLL